MKNALQRFGKFLSAMVMPNIGAFIAWGFITALFIADGWFEGDSFYCMAVDMQGNPLENVSFDVYENEQKVTTYITGADGQTPIHTPSVSNLRFVKAETENILKI